MPFDVFARADKRFCDEKCRGRMRRGARSADERLDNALAVLGPSLGRPGRPTKEASDRFDHAVPDGWYPEPERTFVRFEVNPETGEPWIVSAERV
jgi:hypothetical protein